MVIYIPASDRGSRCWRPVLAARVSDTLYRITEAQPKEEQWQFPTGRVVYCECQSFGDDFEAWVAIGSVH